ncbi:ATP-dependent helicase HrpB [Rhizobium sp. RU20A]|uniref:ATP-dependent helicase HrpB n=1 Tax=Rhizobium sp. RU20A TaxID=1907412 RepID=UPI000956CA91|nr:ATP-dependent helicase HrpB [Rhizobium sp. RU20A]SIQ82311.1 ATP-dependent helicase HrpB [Rhizobium sp. RU20A]
MSSKSHARPSLPELPVSAVLDAVGEALGARGRAVLSAPPGAGKTTLVPLHLLDAEWLGDQKIILLEPRRLAARAAAGRMALLLSEAIGETVGYRMRLDTRVSARTRIEVVTEGVFARMILDDPELSGIGAVIFDEFHERSLDGDFGLALALDVQSALRDDLRILVMSATLDVQRVSALLGQPPVIESLGRSHPVDIRYRDRSGLERIEDAVAKAIMDALDEETGSILAFLPGRAEIERVAERLATRTRAGEQVVPLYGNLDMKAQDAAIRPAAPGTRKIVLATSIAETSITIDGVRIVIDSGLQRLPVHEAATGITRLETVRVSRASADQRAGRAGRTEPGIAIRLWHSGQTAAMPAHTPPEILASDLSSLALDMIAWGVNDPSSLSFIDPPPEAGWAEAIALLKALGALTPDTALTPMGRRMQDLALPPRLAAMVLSAPAASLEEACLLATLIGEQGLGGTTLDLDERLQRARREGGDRAERARALARRMAADIRAENRMRQATGPSSSPAAGAGALLLLAFPDRIALQRGGRGRFVMANGRGAEIEETERLAGAEMLVIADLTGRAGRQRILSAAAVSRSLVEAERAEAITTEDVVEFEPASRSARGRRQRRLGAIVLDESPLPKPKGEAAAGALVAGIRQIGLGALPFSREIAQLRDRIAFLHRAAPDGWPDVSDTALIEELETWLAPFLQDVTGLGDIGASTLRQALVSLLPPGAERELERQAPTHFEAPTGQRHPIRYDGDEPVLAIRVQELFGLTRHPVIAGRIPLLLELLSPGQRPIQMTRDLPGFWAGSWKDVRSEMRGRYPKHPWPDDPAQAAPTHRAKPRGT